MNTSAFVPSAMIFPYSASGNASAPTLNTRICDRAFLISGISIMLIKNEGVHVITSTPFSRIRADSASGLWISSSFAMQTVIPWYSGIHSSRMDTSKVMAANASETVAL